MTRGACHGLQTNPQDSGAKPALVLCGELDSRVLSGERRADGGATLTGIGASGPLHPRVTRQKRPAQMVQTVRLDKPAVGQADGLKKFTGSCMTEFQNS